jgi:WD40 repeat protein
MSAWKLVFVGENLVSCGDLGHIEFYDVATKIVNKKLEGGEIFLTAVACCNGDTRLAAGNNNGDLFVVNLEKKDRVVEFKPHCKMIRSLSFSEDSNKILSGSDDCTLKVFDIVSEKVISSYDGHKETVSCVKAHPIDNKTAFSCSFDKSLKVWDLRMKNCVDSFQSGSALWAV